MSDAATALHLTARSEAPSCADGAGWARAALERQLWMLGQLAEGGLEIARAIERQATQAGSGEGQPAREVVKGDIPLAYARVARAVRLTLLLQSKVIEAIQALERKAAEDAARAALQPRQIWPSEEQERKTRILRVTQRIALAEHARRDVVEGLVRDAAEKLEQDDIYGAVFSRPISEMIAHICHDLGLSPDWPRLAEEAWAQEEMRSGTVGGPLKRLGEDLKTGLDAQCSLPPRWGSESVAEGDGSNGDGGGGNAVSGIGEGGSSALATQPQAPRFDAAEGSPPSPTLPPSRGKGDTHLP